MNETKKHQRAYETYQNMEQRSYQAVATKFSVSLTSVKKWARVFNWQDRVVVWDNAVDEAVKEGVQVSAMDAIVDLRIKDIEQLKHSLSEVGVAKKLIFSALNTIIGVDEDGEKYVTIQPKNIKDAVSLINATSKLNEVQLKIIEMSRKIRGETDNTNVETILKIRYENEVIDCED